MDVFEIEIENAGLTIRWYVTHNGDRFASGTEFTEHAAVERAQHAVDLRVMTLRWAA